MGADNSRGAQNERAPRAAQDTQKDIAEAREAGVPEDGTFCGYVVHVPTKDDYLANVIESDGDSLRNYCRSPEHATRYASRDQAERAAAELRHPGIVGVMFDLGSRLMVMFDARDVD